MATEKPRFSVTFSDESFKKIQKFKDENNISTQSKAVAQLVSLAIRELERSGDIQKAPLYSSEAMEIARDFDTLDRHGRQTVRVVMDQEMDRMAELEEMADAEPEMAPKVINIFVNPSAAGPALGETGQACEPYELRPEDPQGAEYAVRIQGDSMEPDFPNGGIAFVNHDEMRDGDIGIFCVDGATVIKQWHYDRMLGMTYLFSLNRARADADVVLTRSNDRGMVWQGRVITRKHYPLPGME